ncbi:porin family protein [soil metagenome]
MKIIKFLILMLMIPAFSSAQNNSRFGLKGGVNLSNLYSDDVSDKNSQFGFQGGLFLKIALTDYISFQPEVIYTMKGAELKYENDFVTGTANFRLNYIEVPVLAVINLTTKFNVHGGFYIATLSDVSVKNESSIGAFDFEKELNKNDFEKTDYGLVAGIGGDFDKISVGLRYDYGLRSVGKEKTIGGQTRRFPDSKNSTLQLYVSISIL